MEIAWLEYAFKTETGEFLHGIPLCTGRVVPAAGTKFANQVFANVQRQLFIMEFIQLLEIFAGNQTMQPILFLQSKPLKYALISPGSIARTT